MGLEVQWIRLSGNWWVSLVIKNKLSCVTIICPYYTVTKKADREGQNVTFFRFSIFSESLHQNERENAQGEKKLQSWFFGPPYCTQKKADTNSETFLKRVSAKCTPSRPDGTTSRADPRT